MIKELFTYNFTSMVLTIVGPLHFSGSDDFVAKTELLRDLQGGIALMGRDGRAVRRYRQSAVSQHLVCLPGKIGAVDAPAVCDDRPLHVAQQSLKSAFFFF